MSDLPESEEVAVSLKPEMSHSDGQPESDTNLPLSSNKYKTQITSTADDSDQNNVPKVAAVNVDKTISSIQTQNNQRRPSLRSNNSSNNGRLIPECFDGIDWALPPKPSQNEPVNVRLEPFFRSWEVRPIDGKERICLTFTLVLFWTDERFIKYQNSSNSQQDGAKPGHPLPDLWPATADLPIDLWRPELFSLYVFDMLKIPQNLMDQVEVPPPTFLSPKTRDDGKMTWELNFDELPMDMLRNDLYALKTFPFDSGRYNFGLCLSGEKRLESDKDVVINLDNKTVNDEHYHIKFVGSLTSGEFYIDRISYALGYHSSPAIKNLNYKDIFFSLHIARNPAFYLSKGVIPLIGICSFGFLGFFMEIESIGDRLGLFCTMFLTVFAVQWLTVDRLPRVSYNTTFDYVVIATGNALFLMALSSCIWDMEKQEGG